MSILLTLSPSKLAEAIERTLIAGLVPYVTGSPGIGKSDLFRQFSKKYNLKYIDVRLSTHAPEDLTGLPMRKEGGEKAVFAPFDMFPIEGDDIPEGYNGWFIAMDELSSATKAMQAAAYKVILDRMVGLHNLHERVVIAAAGNKITDRAVVVPMSTAMQSRLVHFEAEVSQPDWMQWAYKNKIDSRIIGFLHYKPSMLHQFRPDHQDKTFPCPRTWEFVHKLIKGKPQLDEIDQVCIAGAISDGPAVEFTKFAEIADSVPKISAILADPKGTEVPRESSFRFFVTTALMDHADKDNFADVVLYMDRLPEEYQVIFLRGIVVKNDKLRTHPEYINRISKILRFVE